MKPPSNVTAVFTSVCHYRCRFCSNRLHVKDMWHWSYEDITTKLDALWSSAKDLNIGGCGEVTLLPFFEQLLEYFDTKPGRICFSTNGHRLRPELVRRYRLGEIVISLHSLVPDTYDALTGTKGHWPTVVANTRAMMARPHDYRAVIAAVVTQKNVLEAPALARFALEVGADEMRFLPLCDPVQTGMENGQYDEDLVLHETPENLQAIEEANAIMGKEKKVVRGFLTTDERREVVRQRMPLCQSPSQQLVINMDGTVQPCCFIPPTYGFGNVLEQPWEEVWNSPKYQEFRAQTKAGTCKMCLDHCKNWG